ncbi:hypothetical protein BJV74DRAFT_905666 [Russula compacta]|nr:hypothetical protein BJV74DRAFT_905666 [Russula compacta]
MVWFGSPVWDMQLEHCFNSLQRGPRRIASTASRTIMRKDPDDKAMIASLRDALEYRGDFDALEPAGCPSRLLQRKFRVPFDFLTGKRDKLQLNFLFLAPQAIPGHQLYQLLQKKCRKFQSGQLIYILRKAGFGHCEKQSKCWKKTKVVQVDIENFYESLVHSETCPRSLLGHMCISRH